MQREEILDKLNHYAPRLAKEFGFNALYLFGSVARDEAGEHSDVDLFIEFSEPIGIFEFVELKRQFEFILGCDVDLGTKRSLKQEIFELIKEETIRVA
jgi:hypothetical protein